MTHFLPVLLLSAALAQAGANPFDPAGYIEGQAKATADRATSLTSKGVYKIDGRRYLKYATADGVVFMPGSGETPDLIEGTALCEDHLPYKTEVLKIRDGLPIDAATRSLEKRIVAVVWQCREGRIRGPVVEIETPSGAVVQMAPKAKEGRADKRAAKDADGGGSD